MIKVDTSLCQHDRYRLSKRTGRALISVKQALRIVGGCVHANLVTELGRWVLHTYSPLSCDLFVKGC